MASFEELFDRIYEENALDDINQDMYRLRDIKDDFAEAKKNKDIQEMYRQIAKFRSLVESIERQVDDVKSGMTSDVLPMIMRTVATVLGVANAVSCGVSAYMDHLGRKMDKPGFSEKKPQSFERANKLYAKLAAVKSKTPSTSIALGTMAAGAASGAINNAANTHDMVFVGATKKDLKNVLKIVHGGLTQMEKELKATEKAIKASGKKMTPGKGD